MRRIAAFLCVLAVVISFGVNTQPAIAAGESWTVVSLNTIGCNIGGTTFTTLLSGVTLPTTLRFRTIVDAGGIRYMDEDAGTPGGGNGNYGWALYFSSSGGPATNAWPIPNDTSITVQFSLIDGVGGPAVFSNTIQLTKCNGGTIASGATAGAPGPGIPAGFVLRTITCDVAVFDSADGTPVGDNRIIAGQTWFVNPETVADANGEDWTEIFVSGVPNGFIPSRCVQ